MAMNCIAYDCNVGIAIEIIWSHRCCISKHKKTKIVWFSAYWLTQISKADIWHDRNWISEHKKINLYILFACQKLPRVLLMVQKINLYIYIKWCLVGSFMVVNCIMGFNAGISMGNGFVLTWQKCNICTQEN